MAPETDIGRLIEHRRSIRKFAKKPVGEEIIDKILNAARWAPSGLNNQLWRFHIMRDESEKQAVSKYTKYGRIIEGSAVCICVYLDTDAVYDTEDNNQNTACFNQNIICFNQNASRFGAQDL